MNKMVSLKEKDNAVYEKRKHIRLTLLCNNNCEFCLASDNKYNKHIDIDKLFSELDKGINEGYERLILSGGEPTIHPKIVKIIEHSKKIGYKKIQMITNGRTLSSNAFLKSLIDSGLDEITFSVHGLEKTHDELTKVKGAFFQVIKGIKNALSKQIIVSVDVVLNKKNYQEFPKLIKFLINLGVGEFDILHIVPFGKAYDNKENLFYDLKDAMPYIKKGFDIAIKKNCVIWTNRFPAKYLEGYEFLIQDSHKFIDEIRGRSANFSKSLKNNEKFSCEGERCQFCHMEKLCNSIKEIQTYILKNTFKDKVLQNKNYYELDFSLKKLPSTNKIELLSFPKPTNKFSEYKSKTKPAQEIKKIIKKLIKKNPSLKLINFPYCFLDEHKNCLKTYDLFSNTYLIDNNIDLELFTKHFSNNYKIKGINCETCLYNPICEGVYQDYIRIYGFKELTPILK